MSLLFVFLFNMAQSLLCPLSGHLSKYYVILALPIKIKDKRKKVKVKSISIAVEVLSPSPLGEGFMVR
jgi:hypothetical protein